MAGLSGSFSIRYNGKIKTIPYTDYKIVPTYDADETLASFKVTTSLGVTYQFALSDEQTIQSFKNANGGLLMLDVRNYYSYLAPITFRKTWYLTEIASVQGGRLTFHYQPVKHADQTDDYLINSWIPERQDTLKTYRYNSRSNTYQAHWEYYLNVSETQPYDLTEIISTNGKVTFTQGNVLLPSSILVSAPYWRRLDVKMKKPLLSRVSIYKLAHKNGDKIHYALSAKLFAELRVRLLAKSP